MIELIQAFQKDEALLAEIRSTTTDANSFACWWLGQSGFLIKWAGKHLLLDPYLSDSLTKKYAATTKPHVRMTELAVDPARLDFVDVVTSSHNHTDHLDAETLMPLMQANPKLKMVIPEANRAFVAERIKCELDWPVGLVASQSVEIQGFKFTAVPAAHEAIDKDAQGRCLYLGYVVQFGGFTVYHSGDTVLYPEMAPLLRPFEVDVAFLPINGRDPKRGVAGNLDCAEAAALGKAIGAQYVVPCHYDMFEFNTADVRVFEKEAKKKKQGFRVMRCGEGVKFGV
ncbi:MAG: MBL fold metallo-hydrolase [Saprospiraceae bacterium]|jgi:L-ascorbate metabolism protein UlaG (beta-lactamase superfamily)|nr:MBL fold metallo-hydrolase [Saprospiraceae bacterium]